MGHEKKGVIPFVWLLALSSAKQACSCVNRGTINMGAEGAINCTQGIIALMLLEKNPIDT